MDMAYVCKGHHEVVQQTKSAQESERSERTNRPDVHIGKERNRRASLEYPLQPPQTPVPYRRSAPRRRHRAQQPVQQAEMKVRMIMSEQKQSAKAISKGREDFPFVMRLMLEYAT